MTFKYPPNYKYMLSGHYIIKTLDGFWVETYSHYSNIIDARTAFIGLKKSGKEKGGEVHILS